MVVVQMEEVVVVVMMEVVMRVWLTQWLQDLRILMVEQGLGTSHRFLCKQSKFLYSLTSRSFYGTFFYRCNLVCVA